MADVSWTLDTSDDGSVTVDYLLGNPPTIIRGSRQQLRLGFDTSATYTTVREYLDFAGNVSTVTALNGTVFYRENQSDTHELLMEFNPDGADIPSDTPGLWGVIMGGEDRTRPTMTGYELEMDVLVLAEHTDYASRSAAQSAHEV